MSDAPAQRCQPSLENTLRELGDAIFLGLAVDNWLARMPIRRCNPSRRPPIRENAMMEAYMDTAVFGPHRWMISGSDDHRISQAQFTSKHDAETAISIGHAFADEALRELSRKITDILP